MLCTENHTMYKDNFKHGLENCTIFIFVSIFIYTFLPTAVNDDNYQASDHNNKNGSNGRSNRSYDDNGMSSVV